MNGHYDVRPLAYGAMLLLLCSSAAAGERNPASLAARSVDACALLSAADIRAVQGDALLDTKAGEQAAPHFRLLQCYYVTTIPAKAVSLAVAVPGADPNGPVAYWHEHFNTAALRRSTEHDGDADKKELASAKGRDQEGDGDESGPPIIVNGLGREAFWAGNDRAGALYVLAGDWFLRVSVGGPGNQEAKLARCRTLAQRALAVMRKR